VDIKRAAKSRTVGRKACGTPWRPLEILVLVVRVPEGYQSCSTVYTGFEWLRVGAMKLGNGL